MVKGFDRFRGEFSEFPDQYVLIGGTACSLLLEEAGIEFRTTKDFDIVLCMEVFSEEFRKKLWSFISEGMYKTHEKSDGTRCFYRFIEPKSEDFPFMLEFFSRLPEDVIFSGNGNITPIPAEDEALSLSAILLNDVYYSFLMEGRYIVQEVSTLKPEYIVPLKARAWLDLSTRKSNGEKIRGDDVKKHKRDVFRIAQLFSLATNISLPEPIENDLIQFLDAMPEDSMEVRDFISGSLTKEQIIDEIRKNYALDH